MTEPTIEECMRRAKERISALKKSQPGPKWLDGYSGQNTDQLLSLEGEYRTDSLVLAFEQAISQKAERNGLRA